MLNEGKVNYENIRIPDDRLLASIGRGINKERKKRKISYIRNWAIIAATFLVVLFIGANDPILYSYAREIPVVKTFVQAFKIGDGGGKSIKNAITEISSDKNSITFSFRVDGKQTSTVPKYTIAYYEAPSRMQINFSEMNEELFEKLQDKIVGVKAIKEIYMVKTSKKKDISLVIELNDLYNYEVMEFSNPGSLTISFYQDAYYE